MQQNERHSDLIDEAAALSESLTAAAIAAVRHASGPESHPDFDGESCVKCGDDIHPDRLALGKILCIFCQTKKERMQKQVARPGWNSAD